MVVTEPVAEAIQPASPAQGPSTMAAATARFKVTIGLPVIPRADRRGRGLGQSVRRPLRLVVDGGDRGLHLVFAHTALPQGLRDQRHPLGDEAAIPEGAVLVAERNQLAIGPGAGQATGVGEQHQGEQPRHLGVLGQGGPVILARRMASPDRSVLARPGPLLLAYPSSNRTSRTWSTDRRRWPLSGGGRVKGSSEARSWLGPG